jgi:hypothetical protein
MLVNYLLDKSLEGVDKAENLDLLVEQILRSGGL